MTEMKLINILDDLTDDEFETFKWFLKKEKYNDIDPIKVKELEKAKRRDAVDLMVHKYKLNGTLEVMISVLTKINRNDLVENVEKIPENMDLR